jgi:hypothetical protein
MKESEKVEVYVMRVMGIIRGRGDRLRSDLKLPHHRNAPSLPFAVPRATPSAFAS